MKQQTDLTMADISLKKTQGLQIKTGPRTRSRPNRTPHKTKKNSETETSWAIIIVKIFCETQSAIDVPVK